MSGGTAMGGETGVVKAISELAFWVKDLDRSVAFYRDQLGFAVAEVDPGRNAFLRSGDFLLVLFVPDHPGTQFASDYLARTGGPRGGLYHVAFRIDRGRLDPYTSVLHPSMTPPSPAELRQYLQGAVGMVAGMEPVPAAVIESADRLRVISRFGVGYDNIDVAAATRRGVLVTYIPDAMGDAVADLAV